MTTIASKILGLFVPPKRVSPLAQTLARFNPAYGAPIKESKPKTWDIIECVGDGTAMCRCRQTGEVARKKLKDHEGLSGLGRNYQFKRKPHALSPYALEIA